MIKKLLFGFMSILSLFGIFFVSLLAHEGTHIIQSKSPQSICYNMQQKTFMSVEHSGYENNKFKEFVSYSEKWANIVYTTIIMGLSVILGILINLFIIFKIIRK